jgi:SLT domain-containing protein
MSTNKKQSNLDIKQFIQCLSEKNYAQADKYLQAAVERKLEQHMRKAKSKNIFK